jgi:protoheme IX farnesyltransferase
MTLQQAHHYYQLAKPKILLLVLIVSYCGMYMAEGRAPDLDLALFTLIGLGFASIASSSLNNYVDRGIDGIMERTKERSLPKGLVAPHFALGLGIFCAIASIVILAWKVNLLTAGLNVLAIFTYIFIYTIWLKRTSEHCTVIGGIAGALPPVMGLTAVTGEINTAAWIMFIILFLWQPPHFWALALIRSDEYRLAGIPMLPVVKGPEVTKQQMLYYTIALAPASLLPWLYNICGLFYLVSAAILSSIYLVWTIIFIRAPFDPKAARKLFLYTILYITLIYTFMLLDCKVSSPI